MTCYQIARADILEKMISPEKNFNIVDKIIQNFGGLAIVEELNFSDEDINLLLEHLDGFLDDLHQWIVQLIKEFPSKKSLILAKQQRSSIEFFLEFFSEKAKDKIDAFRELAASNLKALDAKLLDKKLHADMDLICRDPKFEYEFMETPKSHYWWFRNQE